MYSAYAKAKLISKPYFDAKSPERTQKRTLVYLYKMEIINYTDFRSNLKHWFDKVVDDATDVVIKRKGGKNLVLISLDECNSLKETNYLLTGANRDVLLDSIKELEGGKGANH
jgi:antitoxin YefM